MDESIWIDTRIEVVYYAWFGRDHIAFVLHKLQAGISGDYERYDYAINRKANNEAFLERVPDMIAEGYEYLSEQLAGLLASYVRRMADKYDTNYINKYYYDWLTTTKTLCANYPVIMSWCDNYWTYLNGDGFSIVGKEYDEPRVLAEMGDEAFFPQEEEQQPSQAIEANHDNKPSLPHTQPTIETEPTIEPLSLQLDKDTINDKLSNCFNAKFKGRGVINGEDYANRLSGQLADGLKAGKTQKYFGQVAYLIYNECKYTTRVVKDKSFAQWMRDFFTVIGKDVPKELNPNKYIPEAGEVRSAYYYLDKEWIGILSGK
jgi:hypothetical protein